MKTQVSPDTPARLAGIDEVTGGVGRRVVPAVAGADHKAYPVRLVAPPGLHGGVTTDALQVGKCCKLASTLCTIVLSAVALSPEPCEP